MIKNHPSLDSIDHKFLVTGHTHLECDSDHATIERAKESYKNPIEHRYINIAYLKFFINIINEISNKIIG